MIAGERSCAKLHLEVALQVPAGADELDVCAVPLDTKSACLPIEKVKLAKKKRTYWMTRCSDLSLG